MGMTTPNFARPACRTSLLVAAAVMLSPGAGAGAVVDVQATATIPAPELTTAVPSLSVDRLRSGLDALSARDIDGARAIRDSLPDASLDRHILTWAIALRGGGAIPSGEIAAASRTLAGWPGMSTLRRNSERALYRENPAPALVLQAFGGSQPQTAEGVVLLARAYVATGNIKAARSVLSPFWRTEKLDAADEAAILQEFGAILSTADHRVRMERMFYADRVTSALKIADLAGAKELAAAWAAVIRGGKDAAALLASVPAVQRGAGYAFAEAEFLRKHKKYAEAAAIVLKAPIDRAALVDPDAWWTERRVLSRELLDEGDVRTAYRIVAAHAAESAANAADAEFHAGWYALRGLNDPATAAKHFGRIANLGQGPITLSRAYYWLGHFRHDLLWAIGWRADRTADAERSPTCRQRCRPKEFRRPGSGQRHSPPRSGRL